MSCEVKGIETLNERGRGLSFAREVLRYLGSGSGMLTYSASLCAASVKVLEESATPDVQCVFAPASYKPGLIRKLDDKPGITGGPWQMRPQSRGYVLARSPDPREQPAINPRYLAEDTDRRAMVGGLKFLRRLFAAPSLAKYVVAEKMPGPDVQTDDELLDYARQNGSTVYHASCSCMMGNHAMSVVDDRLRVHGLDALAGHRRLGHAGGQLDQHQRADDHDRRKGRGHDPRRRPQLNGCHAPARTAFPTRASCCGLFSLQTGGERRGRPHRSEVMSTTLSAERSTGRRRAAEGAVFSIIMALSFSHFLNDMMQSLVPALYPMLKSSYGLSFAQIGLITLTMQVTSSLLQPAVGLSPDRRPQPYSLAVGMGVTLVGLLLLAHAGSYVMLLLAATMVGMGSAVFHPEASRVARMASGGRHGLAQSVFQVGGNIGSSLGPILAAFIVIPKGQGSIGWFSLVALLAMTVLFSVGNWYRRERSAPARPRRTTGRRARLVAAKDRLGIGDPAGAGVLESLLYDQPQQLFHLLSDQPVPGLSLADRADLSVRLSGVGGGRDLDRRPARRPDRPQVA